jgi:hypothetical protein
MRLLVILCLMLVSTVSFAGDKVGNGGGVWACVGAQQGISSANLVDLYEAREEFGLAILKTVETEPMNIVQDRADFLRDNLPEYFANWAGALQFVMGNTRYVSAELVVVDDALYRIKPLPKTCKGGQWQYTQFANFTHLGQVLIQKELWNETALAPIDKAALIWHEAIYKWLRDTAGDRDSIRTRQIVGILFSDLNVNQIKMEIQKVLANTNPQPPTPQPPPSPTVPENEKVICLVRNAMNFMFYSGYGSGELEAKGNAMGACANSGSNGVHCDPVGARCEANTSAIPNRACVIQDRLNFKSYTGKGRSETEAFMKAFSMCSAGVNPVHCELMGCE